MKKKKKSVRRRFEDSEAAFVINEEVGQHEINEDYDTEDLSSNVDSDGEQKALSKDFKSALQEHSVLNGKEVKFVKNDLKRVRAVCKKGCGFLIMTSKVGSSQTFRVKTLVGQNCGRTFGNKSASVEWIAQVLVDRFVNVAGMTVIQIIDEIKKSYSVGITYWKAGRAKKIAMDCLVGDGERQYARLYDYVAELLRVKAGTFKIKVNQPQPTLPPRFGSFYMCLEGCKEGFLGSCRPFIEVDGCHLKTSYGGQLLVAVGRDPNDQYFPLTFAVGLMSVFDDILNGVEHRLCLCHLYNNFKKKFGRGLVIRDLMMGAAKATYHKKWEKKMGELKNLNVDAFNWLMGIPTKSWCKHAFSAYSRCDVLINNLSESFNSTILLARDKPIITMMEWIGSYLMSRFASLREKVDSYHGDVMPKQRKRLDREVEKSGNWHPVWAGGSQFEVTHGFTMDKKGNMCRQGASSSTSQAGRGSTRDAEAGAASTSGVGGSATMREGGTRTSSRLAGQILGSQASCN
ncbi:uncharacterized protein LOC106756857 [Vigna radiata var. radiata]|uniref:Uncharacterized protein LOC106756857 n=1 Tax=Vigna radiata var. radiata TaxID=3916 RepID=A0A1S3TME8_VIGRR|nr:uncharacterized protein LOC106756857 [Vigna radiata var. radiata]